MKKYSLDVSLRRKLKPIFEWYFREKRKKMNEAIFWKADITASRIISDLDVYEDR